MLAATDLVVLLFTLTNVLRILASLPQIVSLVRDTSGAVAVSCSTWLLFLLSDLSTAVYAAIVLHDAWMTAVFAASALCNVIIVVLVLIRRQQLAASCVRPLSQSGLESLGWRA